MVLRERPAPASAAGQSFNAYTHTEAGVSAARGGAVSGQGGARE